MKTTIVATYFAPKLRGGVARYEKEVLPRLISVLSGAGCDVSVIVLNDAASLESAKKLKIIKLPVGRDRPLRRIFYDQVCTSFHSQGADVLLSLEGWLPVLPLSCKRSVVVMHDAHAELEWTRPGRRFQANKLPGLLYWHAVSRRAARSSDRILTDSRFAADELSRVFGVPRAKIVPVYCGVGSRFQPIGDADEIRRVRTRYSLPPQFYLFVGPAVGDKNLRFILQTFANLNGGSPRPVPVVVTSLRPVSSPEADILGSIEASGRTDWFHFVGSAEDRDLPVLYSSAHALIFPSLHEGFGLPPVEAMACGLPVLATNKTSVPEVVGDAAIMIDPHSPQSLMEALKRVNEESVRRELINKGFKRAGMFSWDRTAEHVAKEVLAPPELRAKP